VLKKLRHKETIKSVRLQPVDGLEQAIPFDFSKFSEQLAEHLPMCEFLHLQWTKICTKSTDSLRLYLPRVKKVTLDGCFGLKKVSLLTKGHSDHAKWNMDPGSELSKFCLSLTNAKDPMLNMRKISNRALKSIQDTGRVANPDVFCKYKEANKGNSSFLGFNQSILWRPTKHAGNIEGINIFEAFHIICQISSQI